MSGERAKIGFVILAWNSEKVIGNCLRSILALREIEPHAIVIDNGSSDGTLPFLENCAKEYPENVSLICYPKNMGTTVTRNAGIREISTKSPDYYCILDSDTIVNDAAFLAMVKEMEGHPEYGLVGPRMTSSRGVAQVSARSFPTLPEKLLKAAPSMALQKKGEEMELQTPPFPDSSSYPVDYLMSACWLLRPKTIARAGLLDERIFYAPEDAEYCIRVWKAGYQVAYCPRAEIIHEWQRLSKKKLVSRLNWEHIKGLAHMFSKHRYLFRTDGLKQSFMNDARGT